MHHDSLAAWLALSLTALVPALARSADADGAAPTIAADLVVEDKSGQPLVDLKRAEVSVFQGDVSQEVTVFRPLEKPGQYEIQYVPRSGRPGAMSVRVQRPGARVRGLGAAGLQPLVLRPPTALEARLEHVLDTGRDANALDARVGLLHFERDAKGQHQTVAVEVAASDLPATDRQGLQVFARFKDAAGRVRERLAFEQPVESVGTIRLVPEPGAVRVAAPAFERIVWTGHLHLPTGTYSADVLAHDAASGRSAVRRLAFTVADAAPGPQLSSVTVLQPRGFLHLADPVADDPLVVELEPVMPALAPELPAGGDGQVRFFVTLYPDTALPEPLALKLELRRGDEVVGSTPLKLPPPWSSGETRYVGLLATKTLRPAAYVLRLVASQGGATSSGETAFTLVPPAP